MINLAGVKPSVMSRGGKRSGAGRPSIGSGSWRLQCTLPAETLQVLKAMEQQRGVYRTRICREILCRHLIGRAFYE